MTETAKFVLETERLMLREFIEEDAAGMLELNNAPEIKMYTGEDPYIDIDDARNAVINYDHYKLFGHGRWAVLLKPSLEFIGWCGLKSHEDGFIDLGYRLIKRFWGNGYATEAAKACLDYGHDVLGMKAIVGRAVPENEASNHILKKIGMTFEKQGECEGIHNAIQYISERE